MLSYRVHYDFWHIPNNSIIVFWLLEDTSINRRTWDFLQSHWFSFYYEDSVIRRRLFRYKTNKKGKKGAVTNQGFI